ncbi:hypothetical protein BC937DRAFT_91872 [Endogone sp. FLAS-F59071]|nr:hypothetical protein BC937DRAFT_91872 [Endogone sp. FLAS-F59071]|eukprot:RUS15867.1 hypothetical protein BC937DRAFT_91872 [Endogone sp. FLAS-F59071]
MTGYTFICLGQRFMSFAWSNRQAASSTSGGSSGSPVIDIEGNAVALQAGGYSRYTFTFSLRHRPFDETRRLGLQHTTEATLRSLYPKEIGMLVVETVVPKGPASEYLEEGDILITLDGEYVTKFVPLEELLDSSVGREVRVGIERGGAAMEVMIKVQDLHSM